MQTSLVHGTSPTAELEFTGQGNLRHAHMERGVEMRSDELTPPAPANSKEGPTARKPDLALSRRPMSTSAMPARGRLNRPRFMAWKAS